jgi:hypothetical protein
MASKGESNAPGHVTDRQRYALRNFWSYIPDGICIGPGPNSVDTNAYSAHFLESLKSRRLMQKIKPRSDATLAGEFRQS